VGQFRSQLTGASVGALVDDILKALR